MDQRAPKNPIFLYCSKVWPIHGTVLSEVAPGPDLSVEFQVGQDVHRISCMQNWHAQISTGLSYAMNIWVDLNLPQTESNQQITNNLKGAVGEVTAILGLPIQWFHNQIWQFIVLSNLVEN